jgi:hypothetical protein
MGGLYLWKDSWYHYRHQMKLSFFYAIYRTCYYELVKKEPWS